MSYKRATVKSMAFAVALFFNIIRSGFIQYALDSIGKLNSSHMSANYWQQIADGKILMVDY